MKLFDDSIIQDTIKSIAEPIIMNPESDDTYNINGFITNAKLSEESIRHLHSVDKFQRGDCFKIDDEFYMVTGDVITMRGCKYKAKVEYCNYIVPITEERTTDEIIGYLPNGQPVYKKEKVIVGYNVGILKHSSQTESSGSIIIVTNEYMLTVRDTEENRTKYVVNSNVNIEGKQFKVHEVIYSKKGILEVRLNSSS